MLLQTSSEVFVRCFSAIGGLKCAKTRGGSFSTWPTFCSTKSSLRPFLLPRLPFWRYFEISWAEFAFRYMHVTALNSRMEQHLNVQIFATHNGFMAACRFQILPLWLVITPSKCTNILVDITSGNEALPADLTFQILFWVPSILFGYPQFPRRFFCIFLQLPC